MTARLLALAFALISSLAFAQQPSPPAAPPTNNAPPPKRDRSGEAPPEKKDTTISLGVGESRSLSVKTLSRATSSDPTIVDINFNYKADDVKVTALKEGETTLTVWSGTARMEYRVVVAKKQ